MKATTLLCQQLFYGLLVWLRRSGVRWFAVLLLLAGTWHLLFLHSQLLANTMTTNDRGASLNAKKGKRKGERGQKPGSKCQNVNHTFVFPQHGCSYERSTSSCPRPLCQFQSMQVDRTKMHSGASAGAPLLSVLGQSEESEYLHYDKGAFSVSDSISGNLPGERKHAYLKGITPAFKQVTPPNCTETWEGTTLFIQRYEYVNIYHTLTDWWNVFFSLPDPNSRVNIVFLDAHPKGNLDPVWKEVFGGNVTYAQHLPAERTCFRQARFVPSGGSAHVYPTCRDCPNVIDDMHAFTHRFLKAYDDLLDIRRIPGRVVVLDRVPYLAHPRSNLNITARAVRNIRHLASLTPSMVSTNRSLDVRVLTMVDMSMKEQLKAIRQADVLVGVHGAGLTHLVFLDSDAHIVELYGQHDFFSSLASWRPDIHYHRSSGEWEATISENYWRANVVSVIKKTFKIG